MPIFGQKTSILLKLHYFMVIKVNRMLFLFRFSTRKSLLSCPYFLKNTSILLKHTAFIPILVKKRPFSQKHGALMCFFFLQIFHEKLLLSCTWLVKKCQFCQNYTLFWAKKVNMMPFFPFSHKNYCSYVHILSKNVHSLKRNSSHLHVLSKKTSTLLKTQCSHVFFFNLS